MDEVDAAQHNVDMFLTASLLKHQQRLNHAVNAFEIGRCRNCNEKLDDGRSYCDKECADDFAYRQKINKRVGRS